MCAVDILNLRQIGDVRRAIDGAGGHRAGDGAVETAADAVDGERAGLHQGAALMVAIALPALGPGGCSQAVCRLQRIATPSLAAMPQAAPSISGVSPSGWISPIIFSR